VCIAGCPVTTGLRRMLFHTQLQHACLQLRCVSLPALFGREGISTCCNAHPASPMLTSALS
jgi:hypothetical protein